MLCGVGSLMLTWLSDAARRRSARICGPCETVWGGGLRKWSCHCPSTKIQQEGGRHEDGAREGKQHAPARAGAAVVRCAGLWLACREKKASVKWGALAEWLLHSAAHHGATGQVPAGAGERGRERGGGGGGAGGRAAAG